MTEMCTYFITKTDVAQNLIDDFFTGLISEKTEALYAQLNERAEAATMYTLQYIYSVPVTKNH